MSWDRGLGRDEEQALLEALQDRNSPEWNQFVNYYGRTLLEFFRYKGRGLDDADDLGQDTWASFFEAVRKCDLERGHIHTLLRAIAHNRDVDRVELRACRIRAVNVQDQEDENGDRYSLEQSDDSNSVLDEIISEEEQHILADKVAACPLSAMERAALFDRYSGIPTTETAARFQVSPSSIRDARGRAVEKIRAFLNDDPGGEELVARKSINGLG